jgi:hemerythrin-like domain-containing protein
MSIIKHDFGFAQRQTERRFRNLLNLDAMHEANVRANPVPYLERASEHIFQLEKALFEAVHAAVPAVQESTTETVTISAAEYQRLRNCLSIVEAAFAHLVSDAPNLHDKT